MREYEYKKLSERLEGKKVSRDSSLSDSSEEEEENINLI